MKAALVCGSVFLALCGVISAGEAVVDRLVHAGYVYYPHGFGAGIAKKGQYVYLAKGEGMTMLAVIDVSDPRNPRTVRYMEDRVQDRHGISCNPFVCGNLLVYQDDQGRWVPYDVSNPGDPKKLVERKAERVEPNKQDPWIVEGKRLFFGANSTRRRFLDACIFQVYDVGEPFEPKLAATLDLTPELSAEARRLIEERKTKTPREGPELWRSGWPAGSSLLSYRNGNIIRRDRVLHVPFKLAVFGVDISNVREPKMVYKYENGEQINGIAVKEDFLFVCTSNLDIEYRHMNYYRMTTEKGLTVVDVGEPGKAREVGTYRGLACPQHLLLEGNTLYVVGTEPVPEEERVFRGVKLEDPEQRVVLHALDVSDPKQLKCLGIYRFPPRNAWYSYCCHGLIFEDGRLYVGDPGTGLRILDVRVPSKIVELGLVPEQGEANHMALAGDHAYVVNQSTFAYCLYTVDIRDPENPKLVDVGTYIPGKGGGRFCDWFAPGSRPTEKPRYLPKLTGNQLMCVFDLADPAKPAVAGFEKILTGEWENVLYSGGIMDCGEYVYVSAFVRGTSWKAALFVYRRTGEGAQFEPVTEVAIPGVYQRKCMGASAIANCVSEDKIYMVTVEADAGGDPNLGDVKLTIVDVREPGRPKLVGTHDLHKAPHKGPGQATFMYLNAICRGRYLYLSGEPSVVKPVAGRSPKGLYVYNVSDSNKPVFVSDIEIKTSGYGIMDMIFLGKHPALALQEYGLGLSLVDVSDPARPKLAWQEPDPPLKWKVRYPRYGWSAGQYRNGYLFIPRVDRLDVYKVPTRK